MRAPVSSRANQGYFLLQKLTGEPVFPGQRPLSRDWLPGMFPPPCQRLVVLSSEPAICSHKSSHVVSLALLPFPVAPTLGHPEAPSSPRCQVLSPISVITGCTPLSLELKKISTCDFPSTSTNFLGSICVHKVPLYIE